MTSGNNPIRLAIGRMLLWFVAPAHAEKMAPIRAARRSRWEEDNRRFERDKARRRAQLLGIKAQSSSSPQVTTWVEASPPLPADRETPRPSE